MDATQFKAANVMEGGNKGQLVPLKGEAQSGTRSETISKNDAAIQTHLKGQVSDIDLTQKNDNSSTGDVNDSQNITSGPSSKLNSTWEVMMTGLKSLRSNVGSKLDSHVSSPEYLDEIFERLKQPALHYKNYSDHDDDHEMNFKKISCNHQEELT